jgi:hypothetical protein
MSDRREAQAPVASPSAPASHVRRDSVVVMPLAYSTINWWNLPIQYGSR